MTNCYLRILHSGAASHHTTMMAEQFWAQLTKTGTQINSG